MGSGLLKQWDRVSKTYVTYIGSTVGQKGQRCLKENFVLCISAFNGVGFVNDECT
jgi:hypothetical protein